MLPLSSLRFFALTLLLSSRLLTAADWPQLLGPNRSGYLPLDDAAVAGLCEPKLLWERDIGSGYAGAIVVGERVIIHHRQEDELVVDCLDAALGLLHWSQRRATDYVDSFGFDNGPRAVPVSNGEIVVAHGPDGAVSAFQVADGEPLWSLDTAQLFEAPSGFFGRASSPLILEDKLILTPGGRFQDQPAGVVAIDLQTGTLRWTSVADEASYSSPTLTPEKDLLCWMRNQVWLLDPTDGRVKASQALRSSMDASVNASQPLFTDSKEVLLSAGYGVGLHRLSLPELLPVSNHDNLMDAHYSSPILHRGHLFGMHGRAETGQTLRCISLAPPAIRWDAGDSLPGGTFILVGEHLFLMTEQGELWAADATTDKLRLHYREQFLRSGHRAHLAYARGVLYARDSRRLVAIRVHE